MKKALVLIALIATFSLPVVSRAQTSSEGTQGPSITNAVEGGVPISSATSSVAQGGASASPTDSGLFGSIKNFFANLWQKLFGSSGGAAGSAIPVDQKLLADFKAQSGQDQYTWLDTIAQEKNPETAWAYLKAAYDTPAGVVGNPHLLAHHVGELLYKAYGFKGLALCDTTFAFGCYHGIMEVAFDKNHPESYNANVLSAQEGCKVVGDITSPSYWSCIHGMGHGIATFRDYDIQKSLSDCDLLDQKVRTYCDDGVFMEFSLSALPNFYKQDNPIYPCDTITKDYQVVACARSQAQVMRFRFKMTTGEIAKACLDTKDKTIVYHCIDSIGYFVGQTTQGDASKVTADCEEIADEAAAAQCKAAAAGEVVFQNYAGWQTSTKAICNSMSGTYKDLCTTRVDQVSQSYGRN
jgi:hypothetical protein